MLLIDLGTQGAQLIEPAEEGLGTTHEEGHELRIIEPAISVERREHTGGRRSRGEDTFTGGLPQLTAPGLGDPEDGAPSLRSLVGLEEPPLRQALEEVVDGGEGQGGPLAVAALLDDPIEVVAMARLLGKEREENDVGVGGHAATLALEQWRASRLPG